MMIVVAVMGVIVDVWIAVVGLGGMALYMIVLLFDVYFWITGTTKPLVKEMSQ